MSNYNENNRPLVNTVLAGRKVVFKDGYVHKTDNNPQGEQMYLTGRYKIRANRIRYQIGVPNYYNTGETQYRYFIGSCLRVISPAITLGN